MKFRFVEKYCPIVYGGTRLIESGRLYEKVAHYFRTNGNYNSCNLNRSCNEMVLGIGVYIVWDTM